MKKIKLVLIFLILLNSFFISNAKDNQKRVLMIINEGFFAPEYYKPRKIFDEAGFKVTVAGKYKGLISPDKRNTDYQPVNTDIAFEDVDVKNYDAITFAGGNGAWTDYFPNDKVHKILTTAFQENLKVGLLCASTGLLGVTNNYDGKTPIAKGRHVTGYYRVEGILRNIGLVNYDGGIKGKPYVVVDGNLITGRDPESSELFGLAMLKAIKE